MTMVIFSILFLAKVFQFLNLSLYITLLCLKNYLKLFNLKIKYIIKTI
jgi:hypothetical protein